MTVHSTTTTPPQIYIPTAEESRKIATPNYKKRLTVELEAVQSLISGATYNGHMSVVFSGLLDDETRKTLTEKGYSVATLGACWDTPQIRIAW